jgi:hypothetical protein
MPRLKDFLEWLTHPELEKIWAVLDIKVYFIKIKSNM